MAWADYYLPAKSVRRDAPVTGDIGFYKVNSLQMLGLVRSANRVIAAIGETPLAEPASHAQATASSWRSLINGALAGWGTGKGFIRGAFDVEGASLFNPFGSTHRYVELAKLMLDAGAGDGTEDGKWTIAPFGGRAVALAAGSLSPVPYYSDEIPTPDSLGANLYHCARFAKEHVNEPKACLALLTRCFRIYTGGGTGTGGITITGSLAATGCTSAKVYVAFDTGTGLTYTAPVVAEDGAYHLWKTVDPATLFPEVLCTGWTPSSSLDGNASMLVELAVTPEPPAP